MVQKAYNGTPKVQPMPKNKWIRRGVFLALIPMVYLYGARLINIEIIYPNYYEYLVEVTSGLVVFPGLFFYYVIYSVIMFIRGKHGLYARIVLAISLFVVPALVYAAILPEDGWLPEGSRIDVDRFAGDSRSAVTWEVVDGQLVGARNVLVGSKLYDVQFVEGTCFSLFNGCASALDSFTFHDATTAEQAAQALLDQVFLDGVVVGNAVYDFDTKPGITFGCHIRLSHCESVIPYALASSETPVMSAIAQNFGRGSADMTSLISNEPTFDTEVLFFYNFAIFSPTSRS